MSVRIAVLIASVKMITKRASAKDIRGLYRMLTLREIESKIHCFPGQLITVNRGSWNGKPINSAFEVVKEYTHFVVLNNGFYNIAINKVDLYYHFALDEIKD